MSILEELWYGNVHPGELNIQKHSPCKELLALMIRHQDDLLYRLNDEEKQIFEKYADAANEMYSHTNLAAFAYSRPARSARTQFPAMLGHNPRSAKHYASNLTLNPRRSFSTALAACRL